jgi:hypothetical protein
VRGLAALRLQHRRVGGRKPGDKCLYVSTGGFAKDAHYEADRASVPLTLVPLPALRKLLVDHYEDLDAETRALVPLKKLYWPANLARASSFCRCNAVEFSADGTSKAGNCGSPLRGGFFVLATREFR